MKMNRMILIAISAFLPLVAGIAQQPTEAELPKIMEAKVPQMMPDAPIPLVPSPNWHLIRNVAGPTLPPGWVLVGVEAVLQNGNTMSGWQLYLYKPSTKQTAGWLIGIP